MIDLEFVYDGVKEDIESVTELSNKIYNKYFAGYFKEEKKLFERLKSSTQPITDDELEWILTTLPLELFSVSEALSQFQISKAVVKLRAKQDEVERIKLSPETSETKRKEDAAYQMLEHKLLLTLYGSVSNRVENELSFSRELIMSAKKIWDSRRQTEVSNPVGEITEQELPAYTPPTETSTSATLPHEPKLCNQYIR